MLRYIQLVMVLAIFTSCQRSLPDIIEAHMDQLLEIVDYNFHVKPLFSDRCYQCHGPDEGSRKADLRLDKEYTSFSILSDGIGKALIRKNPLSSHVIKRMITDDAVQKMPPAASNLEISDREIAITAKWIRQGAKWKKHWSFIKPQKGVVPSSVSAMWNHSNQIDKFVIQKIKEQGLKESPQADGGRLLRGVYKDLTGLPPTIEDMDKWLGDPTITNYEQLDDLLLFSGANALLARGLFEKGVRSVQLYISLMSIK